MQQLTPDGRLIALEQGASNTYILARYDMTELGAVVRSELVNVIKIRADMDIAEKRLPQGGRSQLTAGGVSGGLVRWSHPVR